MIVGVCHRTSLTFIGGLQASYDNYVRPAVDKVERVKNEPPAEFAIYGRRAVKTLISVAGIFVVVALEQKPNLPMIDGSVSSARIERLKRGLRRMASRVKLFLLSDIARTGFSLVT